MVETLLPPAATTGIDLTGEQAGARDAAVRFLSARKAGEMKVGGFAGTGKTTVIKAVMRELEDLRIAVAALSGKAVSVLRRKGVTDAQTIHRTIYDFDPDDRTFYRKNHLAADAVIIDEASMIDRTLYDDLRWFGLPILFVGDMGQLEPVGQDVNLMAEDGLDVRLTQIHRQAEGNPIIEFSVAVRTGGTFERGEFETVCIGNRAAFWRRLGWADQIICGKNSTRHRVNQPDPHRPGGARPAHGRRETHLHPEQQGLRGLQRHDPVRRGDATTKPS
jgi:exodeoxyribonuclease-5